jgi:RNase H-fold protein (predicted Holliday junction resolvase)|tara:strand:- start:75 stop:224 length:150 start_codon:yes stop_codon:yes gene_type:complete
MIKNSEKIVKKAKKSVKKAKKRLTKVAKTFILEQYFEFNTMEIHYDNKK